MSQARGGVNEDGASFVTAIFGALGSTAQNTPQTLLLGLILSAVAKAVPSIGKKPFERETVEDWLLFGTTLVGALVAGIQSNFTYSDLSSQRWLIALLSLGLVLKTVPSIIHYHKMHEESWEDLMAFVAALASLIAVIPLSPQYAEFGIFCGFLAKQLVGQKS